MNEAIRAQISAFVDGELPENEAEMLLRRMSQDRELRQQAAGFLALGRAMRGERTVPGMGALRERIAAAIDDKSLQQEPGSAESARPGYLRPMAGVAIAATVALAAVLGLQQITAVPDADQVPLDDAVADAVDPSYTVPDQHEDQLREYRLRHSASSAYFGANSINPRLVTLELRDGVLVEIDPAEEVAEEDESEAVDTAVQETP